MGPVFAEAEIDASREEIFDYLLDVASRPIIFGPDMEQFRLFDLDTEGEGAGYRFRFKRGGWVGMTLVSSERPIRLSERGQTGRGNQTVAGLEWELSETPAGLSLVRLSYWTEVTGAAGALDRVTGHAGRHTRVLRAALGRLREQVESGGEAIAHVEVAGGNRFQTGIP
ncbi:MAG: SRPBCC family protein [Solirubrobacterales bacterium]